jgi:hypothetical protein
VSPTQSTPKVHILYLTHNRKEYTNQSLWWLLRNTDWSLVSHFSVADDDSERVEWGHIARTLSDFDAPALTFSRKRHASTVAQLSETVKLWKPEYLVKIDSDVVLAEGWLPKLLAVMEHDRDLGVLGIHFTEFTGQIGIKGTDHIGGVGIMRGSIFDGRPLPERHGRYYGWTEWQLWYPEVKKAWLFGTNCFLLDHVPFEPWNSWREEYVEKGWQRPARWMYPKDAPQLQWWLKQHGIGDTTAPSAQEGSGVVPRRDGEK